MEYHFGSVEQKVFENDEDIIKLLQLTESQKLIPVNRFLDVALLCQIEEGHNQRNVERILDWLG